MTWRQWRKVQTVKICPFCGERLLVVMDYNLISVLESHRLMGIGNSNWTWFFFKSWPKLLTFKCESALKIINIMEKLKKIKLQILFHTFLHELILGTWWSDPSISLFWGTLIIYKNAIRGQFSLYFWLNPILVVLPHFWVAAAKRQSFWTCRGNAANMRQKHPP